jgi:hypothetical protein
MVARDEKRIKRTIMLEFSRADGSKRMIPRQTHVGLHTITKCRRLLVRVVDRWTTESRHKCCTRERSRLLIVRRATLQDITINRLWLESMHLGIHGGLTEARLTLNTIQPIRGTVHISQMVGRVLTEMACTCRRGCHPLVCERHINKRLLVGETIEMRIHLLSLKLVLDTFSVRCVTDQR